MAKSSDSNDDKLRVRQEAVAGRDAIAPELRKAAGEAIAAQKFPLPLRPGMVVSGFMPIKSEINPLPLMRKLAAAGATLALPVVSGHGLPLIMRAWRWDEPLTTGIWGLREPAADAPELDPDILLVPLLAFDRAGHRVGYGAGYYDITLADLRARKTIAAIGIAFASQEFDAVPATDRDQPLDFVLTEREVITIKNTTIQDSAVKDSITKDSITKGSASRL